MTCLLGFLAPAIYSTHRSAGIIFNTRNQPRHREELHPQTVLIPPNILCNSVTIYLCYTP